MNSGQARSRKYIIILRPLLSAIVLSAIVVWVVKDGILLNKFGWLLILSSTLVSMFINILNAYILFNIASVYSGKLTYRQSIHISCLGTFANAAGGLPVGTAIKYAILYKYAGLTVGKITSGLIIYTVAISFFLLAYTTISIWKIDIPLPLKVIPGSLLAISVIVFLLFRRWLTRRDMVTRLVLPFLTSGNFQRVMFIAFSTSTLFILNFWVIALFIFPEIPFANLVFIASVGILTSLGSLLQTVGGIHEASLGISAFISGVKLIDGVQLALTMRLTSLISSGIILALFYLLSLGFPRKRKQ